MTCPSAHYYSEGSRGLKYNLMTTNQARSVLNPYRKLKRNNHWKSKESVDILNKLRAHIFLIWLEGSSYLILRIP